jgi:hypothetical protein
VALACKGPLNARLATGVGLSFFLFILSLQPSGAPSRSHAPLHAPARARPACPARARMSRHHALRSLMPASVRQAAAQAHRPQPSAVRSLLTAAAGVLREGHSRRLFLTYPLRSSLLRASHPTHLRASPAEGHRDALEGGAALCGQRQPHALPRPCGTNARRATWPGEGLTRRGRLAHMPRARPTCPVPDPHVPFPTHMPRARPTCPVPDPHAPCLTHMHRTRTTCPVPNTYALCPTHMPRARPTCYAPTPRAPSVCDARPA